MAHLFDLQRPPALRARCAQGGGDDRVAQRLLAWPVLPLPTAGAWPRGRVNRSRPSEPEGGGGAAVRTTQNRAGPLCRPPGTTHAGQSRRPQGPAPLPRAAVKQGAPLGVGRHSVHANTGLPSTPTAALRHFTLTCQQTRRLKAPQGQATPQGLVPPIVAPRTPPAIGEVHKGRREEGPHRFESHTLSGPHAVRLLLIAGGAEGRTGASLTSRRQAEAATVAPKLFLDSTF
jgi:hypothetical protein